MNDPFIKEYLELRSIPEIGGWGVFTKTDIPQGTVVEISPVITYPHKLMDIALFMTMAEGIRQSDLKIDQYAIQWRDEDIGAFMLGYLSLYNHSNNNNSQFFSDYEKKTVGIVTLRDIRENEQLTVSYGKDWFEKKKDYINYVEF